MAAPTIIKGRDLMLFNSEGHSYAYATNHVFTMTAGLPITIRFGLKQTPSDPDMTPADDNMALPYWTSQNTFYQGKALITSLVANANNGENATYNITLTGVGKIQKVTIDASKG